MSLFSFGQPVVTRAIPYSGYFWFGVAFMILFTGSALSFGAWSAYENYLFDDHARHVEGKVTQKYITTTQSSKGGTQHQYHVAYSYSAGELTYNATDTLRPDNWGQLSEGGPIPIKFLPEKPEDNRIDNTLVDYNAKLKARFGFGVGLVALVVGTIGTITTFKRNKLVERLRATGISCQGRITSLETERVGKAKMLYVRFEFTDNYGRVILGRTWPMSQSQESNWTFRKSIPVYYDPKNSSVFTVVL